MFESLIPSRSPEDLAAGVIRVTLGREGYLLDELPMDAMDAWSGSVDERLRGLLAGLDRGDAIGDVMAQVMGARPLVLESLASYPGVPDAAVLRSTATHSEVLRALMGVWSAANPLVVILVEAVSAILAPMSTPQGEPGDVSDLMSTLRRISDGPSDESEPSSPTASSSPDSTPPPNGSARPTKPASKRSATARSSPGTSAPTNGGSARPTALRAVPHAGSAART